MAFRADAAFAKPEIYDALEKRNVDYAIRMPANKNLELEIECQRATPVPSSSAPWLIANVDPQHPSRLP